MPRLSGPDPSEVSSEVAQLLALTERDGRPPATIELLAHREALLGPFLGWAAALARGGVLAPRHHELLALRASHLCSSSYEWHEHGGFARDLGMSDAEIDDIAVGDTAERWTETEQLLLRAADELVTTGVLDSDVYDELAERFSPDELVEIPLVVGQYTMLSMMCGFFDVGAGGVSSGDPSS